MGASIALAFEVGGENDFVVSATTAKKGSFCLYTYLLILLYHRHAQQKLLAHRVSPH